MDAVEINFVRDKVNLTIFDTIQTISGVEVTPLYVLEDLLEVKLRYHKRLNLDDVWESERYFYTNYGLSSYDYRAFLEFINEPSKTMAAGKALKELIKDEIKPFNARRLQDKIGLHKSYTMASKHIVYNKVTDSVFHLEIGKLFRDKDRIATIDNSISFIF